MNEPLQICGTGVTGISQHTFACLAEVRTLLLTDNKIQNLRLQAFSHLTSLQQLVLNNNSLNSMSAISEPNPNLVDLNASNNMIERFDGSFSVLPSVTCLDFSHNRIDHVQNNTFSFCLKLERLYLQHNSICWIETGGFRSVSGLRILNLAHNRLFYVHQYLFAEMYSLRELYLNDNLVRHIESDTFLSVERLHILNLANNRLSNIMGDLFANTSILSELYLCGNILQHIKTDILVHSTILSPVTLGWNPWECNCELDPLRLWLKEYRNITMDLQETTCFGTKGIIAFRDSFCEEPGEEQNSLFVVVGILSALRFVLFVGTVTIYRFRLDIQVLLFAKCGIRIPGKQFPPTEDQNRTYDAFVSYNSSDERFVLQDIMPKLERQPPFYKIFLHFRDFALGAAVAENIVEAIDTCKQTIMLISKDFLQSDWCQYEFQMAHHQVLTEGGRNRLILVMMEQIDISDITDHTLKSYIRTLFCFR